MSRRITPPDQIDARERAESQRSRTRLDRIAEGLPENAAEEFARRAALAFLEDASFAAERAHQAAAWPLAKCRATAP